MFTATEKDLAEVRAKYPDQDSRSLLETPMGDVIVRKASFTEFARFQDQVAEKKLGIAQEMLLKTCVVWPDAKAFSDGLNAYPAAQSKILEEVLKLSGQKDDIISRKF